MQFFSEKECISICLKNTNKYVHLAVEGMKNDFERVSESGIISDITDKEMIGV
ncbi:MAG: hypothetical protein J6A69_02035 [Clostridia bacterium]|nr:hypothetical protein [Clostridia bacterium]